LAAYWRGFNVPQGGRCMGLVTALKFNSHAGALVSDEEMWSIRFRRKMYLDNLHSLIESDISDALQLEVAIGGAGYPSLLFEMVEGTRREVRRLFQQAQQNPMACAVRTVQDVGKIALAQMHKAIRRRLDLRMKFFYGFDSADLMRGFYEVDGVRVDIKQEAIKSGAKRTGEGNDGSRVIKPLLETTAALFGYDRDSGFTGYYLDAKHGIMAYNHEGWEAIGKGKYISGASLARWLNRQSNPRRKAGYAPAEGLFQLLRAGLDAADLSHQANPDLHIVLIDGSKATHAERYREVEDDVGRQACEIVRVEMAGFIAEADAQDLIDRLVFQGESPVNVEQRLRRKAAHPELLSFLFRGYKQDDLAGLCADLNALKTEAASSRADSAPGKEGE